MISKFNVSKRHVTPGHLYLTFYTEKSRPTVSRPLPDVNSYRYNTASTESFCLIHKVRRS